MFLFPAIVAAAPILFDNGPFVTGIGTGAGGANVSAVQSSLGMGVLGYGNQVSAGIRVADDFTVPAGPGWDIGTIAFYGYQTGAGTGSSSFTSTNLQIWAGQPGLGGSSVVWGDTATNRLTSSTWTGAYRVLDTGLTGTTRPIFANTVTVNTLLSPGTHWLDWQADGSLPSGPWVPPITILGLTVTGNAIQYTGAWVALVDIGPQGLPFTIYGPGGSEIPEPGSIILLGTGLVALALVARRRRSG